MLGLSKSFVIFLFISILIGYKMDWGSGLLVMGVYATVKITWNILTK